MSKIFSRSTLPYLVAIVGVAALTIGVLALLISINERQTEARQYPLMITEIGPDELDPAVWGQNFPMHYDRFMMTQLDTGATPYGGSSPYSKIERYPAMVRLWAGYAFSVMHNEERGHFYALSDQKETRRVTEFNQPGACANCHAAEAPLRARGRICPLPPSRSSRSWRTVISKFASVASSMTCKNPACR